MNKKKNNRKIISVLIVLACFVLLQEYCLQESGTIKQKKKKIPFRESAVKVL